MSSASRRIKVRANGVTLVVVDYRGEGPAALLLHGLAGRATEWRSTAEWLQESFRVVALDQRGHGESEKGCADFSRDAYVGDVVQVIHALNLAPAILIGQSMGALTAYLVAARHPDVVRALLLIEAGLTNDPASGAEVAKWLDSWPLPFDNLESARSFFGGDTHAARTWADSLVRTPQGYEPAFNRADVVASIRDHESAHDYDADWAKITCPTCLVLGEGGWISGDDVARMRRVKPDLEVLTIPGAAHDVHLVAGEAWRAAAESFL